MKTIYVLGDSHVSMFDGTLYRKPGSPPPVEPIKVVFVDATSGIQMTAYSLEKNDLKIRKTLDSINFQAQDEMWFVVGEIDVRFHIFYHHQRLDISLDESIEKVADVYIEYVNSLKASGYNIHVVSVVPPQPNMSTCNNDPSGQILNPIRGEGNTMECRIYTTKKLNELLQEKCKYSGIVFRDIYPYLVDPNTGCNTPDMTRDGMHYWYVGDLVIDRLGLGDENAG